MHAVLLIITFNEIHHSLGARDISARDISLCFLVNFNLAVCRFGFLKAIKVYFQMQSSLFVLAFETYYNSGHDVFK